MTDQDAPNVPPEEIYDPDNKIFQSVIATAYYPVNNNTWTSEVMKYYGDTITWKPWNPNAKSIDTITVNAISDQYYTGQAVVPGLLITDNGYNLLEGTDYTVEYIDNVNIGSATVIITGIGNYTGSKNVTFKIVPAIEVNAKSIKLKKGQSTKKFQVTGIAAGDYVQSWKSSNTKIVKVSGNQDGSCRITAQKKTGKATITITLASGMQTTLQVTVQNNAVQATKISGVQSKLTLKKGKTKTLKPTIAPITCVQKITYTSSNKKIATVNSKGKITARKKGKCTITVKCGNKTKKCIVTVK